ncbi:DUF2339 domain-containing protein [Hymenobacter cellulosivorans]|uniref:DUF2339 domain-containing protein n=1 Tax=Hymenobacter cellulosivorans TaxID=2932249 RepID=A0ABY4FEF0_9BACT|nr:DUF2339 domain-containing protein [Hymenobacter cellulosivorans]UOQ55056.1 DUF2339 domain-containing protein [Hymenobacter cellulosivorans]
MEALLVIVVTVVVALVYHGFRDRLKRLEQRLTERETGHAQLLTQVEQLRRELQELRDAPPIRTAPPRPAAPVAAAPATAASATTTAPAVVPARPVAIPATPATPVEPKVIAPLPAAPAISVTSTPVVPPVVPTPPVPVASPVAAPEPVAPVVPPVATPAAEPAISTPTVPPAPVPTPPTAEPVLPPVGSPAAPVAPPVVPTPSPAPAQPKPAPSTEPRPAPRPEPKPESKPEPVFTPPAPPRPAPRPVPTEPAEPTWWERTEQVLLDNWTGILGAVVLVIGVGFLGIYTAVQVKPPVRFAMISGFAGALLGLNYYLRTKPFAQRLHVWLQSSAAAIFLFACVGATSVPGLQWAAPPLSYGLLLTGVAANLWLAWTSSRESVATLHGVLSLVALAVIPPDLITLGTATAVTAFCIAITYRQQWKYQLLLSILSFFVFHQYWHFHLAQPLTGVARVTAMSLVVLVGVAAAVVQYRRVYADSRFDALLFAAHVLNWTTLGFNLYQYSTGSPWKTIPLALGAVLTFFVARRARQLGIQWLFQTDTIISLILALATAFSLQGWHATGPVVGLFMLLEALLIAFIMAREREALVFRVASVGALLAGAGLLVMITAQLTSYSPAELQRNALIVFLAASLGAGYFRLTFSQPLLEPDAQDSPTNRALHQGFGGLVGALYLSAAALVLQALFGIRNPSVGLLIGEALAAAGVVFALARQLRGEPAWFRTLHFAAGQVLLTVAILGLHKLGLVWPATAAVLYLEVLALTWLLGRATEVHAFRMYLGAALLAGLWLLLAGTGPGQQLPAASLHRNALLLLGAGLLSAVFFRQLSRPLWLSAQASASPERSLHQGLGGLTGVLYLAGAGVLLQALFGPPQPPALALISGAAVAAGLVFGLSRWLRGSTEWFRILHLLAGQMLLTVAILGLHKLGLVWPATAAVLYLETLALTWLLSRATEVVAFRMYLGAALLAGFWLLLAAGLHWSVLPPAALHRNTVLLLAAGLASAVFFQLFARQLWLSAQVSTSPDRSLYQGLGGLTGVLYLAGAGLLLQALFGPPQPPAAALVSGAVVAAGLVFGLSRWLHGGVEWFRILHLLVGQLLLSIAVLGLHKLGLSWPLTTVLLYAEFLLMLGLLAGRREWWVYRVQLYATLLLATLLPVVVYGTGQLSPEQRALLLTLAALATAAAQATLVRLAAPEYDLLPFSYNPAYRLRVLGTVAGLLLLAAAGLIYHHTWAGWVAVGIAGALLALRRSVRVPGLWVGLLLAAAGYHLLQWHHVLVAEPGLNSGAALLYLLPLVLLAAPGLAFSWWQAQARHVRWPWLYLLGLHVLVLGWATAPVRFEALAVLVWCGAIALAAGAAQWLRRRFSDPAALTRQGSPDRHLLHVAYGLLAWALLWHFYHEVPGTAELWHVPTRRLTAAALVLVLAGLAWRRPPATAPVYRSWQLLHPYLPELTLLFLGFTLGYEVRLTWLALSWLALAFALTLGGGRLPEQLHRVQLYGVLFFWLSTIWATYVALRYLAPGQLLSVRWLTTAGAVALQFAYAAVALQSHATAKPLYWPAGLSGLARLGQLSPRQLVAALLYPAFVALTVLLVQSFDRSVLTVLLMLEVVALFVSSLLLRRQDFRYASLAGVAVCLVRLVFFDLSQRGTVTRAVVFILMGLLLLGMNALYARFKDRFAPTPAADESAEDFSPTTDPDEPQPAATPTE